MDMLFSGFDPDTSASRCGWAPSTMLFACARSIHPAGAGLGSSSCAGSGALSGVAVLVYAVTALHVTWTVASCCNTSGGAGQPWCASSAACSSSARQITFWDG